MRMKRRLEKSKRNKKIYQLYTKTDKSARELARMFKISHPRILAIVKQIKNDKHTKTNKR